MRRYDGEPNLGNELIKYAARKFEGSPLSESLRRVWEQIPAYPIKESEPITAAAALATSMLVSIPGMIAINEGIKHENYAETALGLAWVALQYAIIRVSVGRGIGR